MIREDDERPELLAENLRHAADDPGSWDVPGLLRDAADRIEWLEGASADEAGDRIKIRFEFQRHADAAVALHAEIMQMAWMVTDRMPETPREAAHQMLGEIARLQRELTEARRR